MTLEKLILECKNDLQTARDKRTEATVQVRVQNEVIETLLSQLGRLEIVLKKSQEPAK